MYVIVIERRCAAVQSLSIILQEIKNHKSKMFEISGGTINSLMRRCGAQAAAGEGEEYPPNLYLLSSPPFSQLKRKCNQRGGCSA